METKILVVEDEFIIASSLKIILEEAGNNVIGIASSVKKALQMIEAERPDWVFLDIYLTGQQTGIDLANTLNDWRIPFIYVSANSNHSVLMEARKTRPLGFLVKPFKEQDVLVTLEVAKYRHEHDIEMQLKSENVLKDQLGKIFAGPESKEDEHLRIITAMNGHIPFNCFAITWRVKDVPAGEGSFFLQGEDGGFQHINSVDLVADLSGTNMPQRQEDIEASVMRPALYAGDQFAKLCDEYPFHRAVAEKLGMRSAMIKMVDIGSLCQLTFCLYGRDREVFRQHHAILFQRLELLLVRIADYFSRIKRFGAITPKVQGQKGGAGETNGTEPLPTPADAFAAIGMIGKAPNFQKVKEQIATVAPFDVSVLVLGESGTGKEKVAQAIHARSERRAKPLVKINCAAIPATLIESELFGYEKGAFTGADDRRIGKFEQADGGTIFLDEIGDIPLELQVKLLNVLQEKEVVRIGGNKVIKTDVRIIAATNRHLEKAIAEGAFRLDLYYRLNVFPITMPALRERKEDIPMLVDHFIRVISQKMHTTLKQISQAALQTLQAYEWPGNIRELENIIERSLVTNKGDRIEYIELPATGLSAFVSPGPGLNIKTIREMEKEHILAALEFCKGRLSGNDGAAKLLDISPTTLAARLKKLGISRNILEE